MSALLDNQIPAGDKSRPHLDRMQRNSRHLLSIIDDVLEISRVESGQLPVSAAEHRLGSAVEEAMADAETQAAAKQLVLTNAVSGAAPICRTGVMNPVFARSW